MNTEFNRQLQFETFAKMLVEDIELQIVTLGEIYQISEKKFDKELEERMTFLNKSVDWNNISQDEAVEMVSYLKGEDMFSSVAKNTLSQYMIVAIYSLYEKGLKKILTLAGFSNSEAENATKTAELSTLLESKDITCDYVDYFEQINELRLLNNNIKHNGLPAINNKREGGDVYEDYDRFKSVPTDFLRDMISKIKAIL